MKVLGIDTILHDVCVAVLENDRILSNEIKHKAVTSFKNSLLDLTAVHIKEIGEVVEKALKRTGTSLQDISLIAVNNSGSLLSNVLIGLVTANVLSKMNNIPIIDINHQEAHIFSNWIERDPLKFEFPILVFSASGGHTLTGLVPRNEFKLEVISEIKGIKMNNRSELSFMGLGALFSEVICYLGLKNAKERKKGDGQFISDLAKKGDSGRFHFYPRKKENISKNILNISNLKEDVFKIIGEERKKRKKIYPKFIADVAASFEKSLAEIITDYLIFLAKKNKAKEIHLVGGISANQLARKTLKEKTDRLGIISRYPKKKSYCTDNAVMIASLGYYKFKQNPRKYLKRRYLDIKSDLVLENLAINQFLEQSRKLD